MTDVLGWRRCFGVVTPSTNTVVQPEYDGMRPAGVTNHVARMHIANDPIRGDQDFEELIRRIDAALEAAVERVLTAEPDHLILGISAESIWGGGLAAARDIEARVRRLAGALPFTQAAEALPAALRALGVSGPVGLVTPYQPIAEKHLAPYLREIGCELAASAHLAATSPVNIARITHDQLRAAILEVNRPEVRAIIQFGANLPMGQLAARAEQFLGKPVIAINVATYWHALRTSGIADRSEGWGSLLSRH
jgi:maleate isomerase